MRWPTAWSRERVDAIYRDDAAPIGGKPAGFKLCIGHPWEFLAICKAMLETKIYPDFIVVDGTEGGTGAAPLRIPTISVSPSSASAATSNCRCSFAI